MRMNVYYNLLCHVHVRHGLATWWRPQPRYQNPAESGIFKFNTCFFFFSMEKKKKKKCNM